MGCPSAQSLQALLDGGLDHAARAAALEHAAGCADCARALCPLGAGDVLGSLQVLKLLGPGHFGLRYVARDTRDESRRELEAARAGAGWEPVALRHRQLAGRSHAGLASVKAVVDERGLGAVVRELDEGPRFDAWLAQEPRPPQQVVRLWVAAGHALAFAHHLGVTHGALALDSVRLDAGGRPRLSGFGAGAGDDPPPERRGDGSPTPEADQFSFAAALVRALTPDTPAEVPLAERFAVLRTRLPRRAVRALERALSPAPERRFPSLEPLLEALRPSRLQLAIAAATAAVLVTAVVGTYLASRPPPCSAASEPLASVWTDARRDALRKTALKVPDPWAVAAYQAATEALGGWVAHWSDQSRQLCLAAHDARPSSEPSPYPAQQACLEEQARQLDALLDELTEADEGALERAPLAWPLLEAPGDCAHPPAAPSEAEAALAKRLFAIDAALATGRFAAARDSAQRAAADARAGNPALAARAALLYGRALAATGQRDEAERALEDARGLAKELPALAGLAAAEEALALAELDGDLDTARSALSAAESALQREPGAWQVAAQVQRAHAVVHLREGQLPEARSAAEAMGLAFEQAHRAAEGAQAYGELASAAVKWNQPAEATAWQQLACTRWQQVVPETHPLLARCRLAWARRLLDAGDARAADAAVEPAVAAERERWRRPRAETIQLLLAKTTALGQLDRHEEALAVARDALKRTESMAAQREVTAAVLSALATEADESGAAEQALTWASSAFDAARAAKQPLAPARLRLALMGVRAGRPADALTVLAQVAEAEVPRGELLAVRGSAELGLKKVPDAVRALRAALDADELSAREQGSRGVPAWHLVALARAELAAGDDAHAESTAARALECLKAEPSRRWSAWAHLLHGAAAVRLGRGADGRAEAAEARRAFEALAPGLRAEGLWAAGALRL